MGRKKFPIFIVLSIFAHLLFFLGLLFFIYRTPLYQTVFEGPGRSPLWVNLGELGVSGGEGKSSSDSSGGSASLPPSKTVEPKGEKKEITPKRNREPAMKKPRPDAARVEVKESEEKVETPERKETPAPDEKTVSSGGEKVAMKSSQGGSGQGQGGSGTGSGEGLGPSGMGGGSGPGGGGSSLLAEIRRRIERAKRYPPMARIRQIEGVVMVSFSIGPGGAVQGISVIRSSGSPILDEEAMATVKRAAPLPYYPNPIRISLRFNLE